MIRIVAALWLLGCAAAPPQVEPAATLTLGQIGADGTFLPYSSGQDVTLVAGAQGGFHVWLSYQMTPAPSGSATLMRTAHRASDDALVLRTEGQVTLSGDPSAPLPMFMCPSPVGLSIIDTPIIYELDLTNTADGNTATSGTTGSGNTTGNTTGSASGGKSKSDIAHGSITMTPHCPTDQLEFCQRICSG